MKLSVNLYFLESQILDSVGELPVYRNMIATFL